MKGQAAMIELCYLPGGASMAPHIVLEESGLPFELRRIDKEAGELASSAYRKLNPNGLVPVLVDGDIVLYETAAICLHLAEKHPATDLDARLMPEPGTAERAHCYKWLSWLSTTLQQALIIYFYPERWAVTTDAIAQVKQHAQARVVALLQQIDDQLASHGGPWLLGDAYRLPDLYAMMLCRWTRNFDSRKAREFPNIKPWLQRVLARPAVQRVFEREGLAQPWV
jgi:glutathione S-transferase